MPDNFLRDYKELEPDFKLFRAEREGYLEIIKRSRTYKMPVDIAGAEKAIDVQTPDLEDALFAIAAIISSNPTYLDVNALSTHEADKRKARNIALWSARTWLQVNNGRWWDRAVAIDQGRFGAAVMRRMWRPAPKTDDVRSWLRYEPFYIEQVNPLLSLWTPLTNDPDRFFYNFEVPLWDAKARFRREDGTYPSLDSAKKLTWVGEPHEQGTDTSPKTKLRILVIDQRVPGKPCLIPGCLHDRREIIEVLCGPGDTEGEVVNRWDSPFKRCSFSIIPGREIQDQDPHWRYRAMLFPAIAEADLLNFTESLIATRARVEMGDRFYADFTKIPEHLQSMWNELSEGGRKSTLPMPSSTTREIPWYPPLQAFPNNVSPHLVQMTDATRRRFMERLPNRFLLGEAFMETRHATGTAFLQSVQSARLPFNLLHANSDYGIWENFDEFFHAMRFWGMGTEKEKLPRYVVALTGREKLDKITASPGEIISVDADMLDNLDFELAVSTDSETLAEQAQRWALAVSKWDRGVLTPEQFLREAGYRDAITQNKELRKADLRAELDPELKQLRLEYVRKFLEIETGLLVSPMGSAVLPEGGGAGAQGQPNPEGAVTRGAVGNMPQQGPPGSGPPAPVSPQSITGRFITPAPTEGPSGGNSPLGGR